MTKYNYNAISYVIYEDEHKFTPLMFSKIIILFYLKLI